MKGGHAPAVEVTPARSLPRLTLLDRYLLREFIAGSLATTAVLLVLFSGSFFASALDQVATGAMPGSVMFTVLGLHLVSSLQMLLSLGTFLGMLMTLGRLYRDSEMHALMASGFGPRGLLKPATIFALVVTTVVALVALWLGPLATRTSHAEVERANRSVVAAGLESGRFTELSGHGGILFADNVNPAGTQLEKLFAESEQTGVDGITRIDVVTAASGTFFPVDNEGGRFITLHHGHRYDVRLGHDDWRLMRFRRSDIALSPLPDNTGDYDPQNARGTVSLIGDRDPAAIAELQWRIVLACWPLVLSLLALPMSRQQPRASPIGRTLTAVLAFLVMMNTTTLARTFIASGHLSASLGMWSMLLSVFTGAAWLFGKQYAVRKPRGPLPAGI